jgi:hypothetical protein
VLLNERKRQFSSDLVRKDQEALYVAYRHVRFKGKYKTDMIYQLD